MSFYNKNNNDWQKDKICFKCGKKGHIAPNCPDNEKNDNNNTSTNNNSDNSNRQQSNVQNAGNSNNGENGNSNGGNFFQMRNFGFFMQYCQQATLSKPNGMKSTGVHYSNNNNIRKAHTNYCCDFSNKGDDQKPENLRNWLLLDSQSTIDIFCNNNLLGEIHHVDEGMTLQTNPGEIKVHSQGFSHNYGWVWYDQRAITNILCLNNIKQKYRVTYDSANGDSFTVHRDNKLLHYTSSNNGLYYHDVKKKQFTLLNTVEIKFLKSI